MRIALDTNMIANPFASSLPPPLTALLNRKGEGSGHSRPENQEAIKQLQECITRAEKRDG